MKTNMLYAAACFMLFTLSCREDVAENDLPVASTVQEVKSNARKWDRTGQHVRLQGTFTEQVINRNDFDVYLFEDNTGQIHAELEDYLLNNITLDSAVTITADVDNNDDSYGTMINVKSVE